MVSIQDINIDGRFKQGIFIRFFDKPIDNPSVYEYCGILLRFFINQ